nr:MAG TPA: hypothetical protein [Caudoviricetes sp.]
MGELSIGLIFLCIGYMLTDRIQTRSHPAPYMGRYFYVSVYMILRFKA